MQVTHSNNLYLENLTENGDVLHKFLSSISGFLTIFLSYLAVGGFYGFDITCYVVFFDYLPYLPRRWQFHQMHHFLFCSLLTIFLTYLEVGGFYGFDITCSVVFGYPHLTYLEDGSSTRCIIFSSIIFDYFPYLPRRWQFHQMYHLLFCSLLTIFLTYLEGWSLLWILYHLLCSFWLSSFILLIQKMVGLLGASSPLLQFVDYLPYLP